MMTSVGSVALVALGFVLGKIDISQESHAQQAEINVSEEFVVVSGHQDGRRDTLNYFVVHADGSATVVNTGGKEISAPKLTAAKSVKMEIEHSFSRSKNELEIEHSGRINH